MNPIFRNILAVIAGIVIGSVVNMGIIMISGSIIPPPEGTNVDTMEGLKAALPFFETKHFIFPFLAHAIGTFVGALVAASIGKTHKWKLALGVGIYFLLGGISAVFILPAPMWFNIVDIAFGYIPFALLAGKIAERRSHNIIIDKNL